MSRSAPLRAAEASALKGLDSIEAAQVRRCARVLLRRPLLRAEGPDGEALSAVRRYAERLQALFAGYLGYRLVVEPAFARLYKSGRTPDGVRGAHKAGGAPFTPRAYAYLALVVAVLTGSGGQLLLSGLVAEVRAAGAEAGLDLGTGIVDRRALAAALRHLVALGVLAETDGSVAPWADDSDREALLTVDVELLGHLVAAPLSRTAGPGALARSGTGDADLRHRVRRRIVEDPVLLYCALTPDERDWLRTGLRRESRLLEDLTGLQLEVRAEGVLAVDPEGYLSDRVFPGAGTSARLALLAAVQVLGPGTEAGTGPGGGAAASSAGCGDGGSCACWTPVPLPRLREAVESLVACYPRAWSKEAVRDTGRLARSVADALAQVGLARWRGADLVEVSPAAARYAPRPDGPTAAEEERDGAAPAPAAGEGQNPLF